MFIYDKLNENVGIDKDSANFLIETLLEEFKKIKTNKKLESLIIEWTKNLKITPKTHQYLKKYCEANGLKMFAFVESLIREKCVIKKGLYDED